MIRLEGLWWMMRAHFYSPAFIALAGWVSTQRDIELPRLLVFMLGVALLSGVAQMVNDIADREADRLTAPYLPLPAGLVSASLARWSCAGLFALTLLLLYLGSASLPRFLATIGVAAVALGATAAYSAAKQSAFAASALSAVVYAAPAAMGWVAAGGGAPLYAALVCGDFYLTMLFGNTLAAIRDMDRDPLVGNRSLPVRFGAERAFGWSVAGSAASLLLVAALIALVPGGGRAILPLVFLAGWIGYWAVRIRPTLREPERGRARRSADLRPLFRANAWRVVLLIWVFSPEAGLVALVASEALSALQQRGYETRIVQGGLARRLGATPSLASPESPHST